jgi:hypothetical protein
MNLKRNRKHMKNSAVTAAVLTAICVIGQICYQLTGFRKFGPQASPKSFLEILVEWPTFLAISTLVFLVTWWWQASTDEITYMICRTCQEVYEKRDVPFQTCIKCKATLEVLEGFYERHPDLKTVTEKPIQPGICVKNQEGEQMLFATCLECEKTFYREDCPGSYCTDCQTTFFDSNKAG